MGCSQPQLSYLKQFIGQGPVIQSIISFKSSFVVKLLTVLLSKYLIHGYFAVEMWVAFANAKATHFLSKNICVYGIFNDQSFNYTLTDDILSFE